MFEKSFRISDCQIKDMCAFSVTTKPFGNKDGFSFDEYKLAKISAVERLKFPK